MSAREKAARFAIALIAMLAFIGIAACGRHPLLNPLDPGYVGDDGDGDGDDVGDAVYVSGNGSAANSGLSPDEALISIQAGLEVARERGVDEVRVAWSDPEGGYYAEQITLVPGVSLSGGYSSDFESRDIEKNPTLVVLPAGAQGSYIVRCDDPEVQKEVVIEGFTFELINREDVDDWLCSGVRLSGGASPTITNNSIHVRDDVVESSGGGILITQGIRISDWGQDAGTYDIVIRGNRIVVTRAYAEHSIGGIVLQNLSGDSQVLIEGNSVSAVSGGCGCSALAVEESGPCLVRNNVLCASESGDSARAETVWTSSVHITMVNNTVVTDGHDGTGIKVGFSTEHTTTYPAVVMNNIVAARVVGDPSGEGISFFPGGEAGSVCDHNLCFGFQDAFLGSVAAGDGNLFESGDLFAAIFSSSFDTDLTDGDDTDYHLLDRQGMYAVDLGMDVSTEEYGGVTIDIDGDVRPGGPLYDIGADEKTEHSVVYVAIAGSDDNSGLTPAEPKRSIEQAVWDVASVFGTGEVRVSEGAYYESLVVQPGVALKGGYSGGFTDRDLSGDRYSTAISASSGMEIGTSFAQVTYSDSATQGDVLEGFTIGSLIMADGVMAVRGVYITGGASPRIRHNRINTHNVVDGADAGELTIAIAVGTGEAHTYDVEITDNEIVVWRENEWSSVASWAIDVAGVAAGSSVLIARNHIVAKAEYGKAYGIQMVESQGIDVRNNIISVRASTDGYSAGLMVRDTVGSVVNNTVISYNAGSGTQYGLYAFSNSDTVLDLECNSNIFGARSAGGVGVRADSPDVVMLSYDFNLCFFFATEVSANVFKLSNNTYDVGDLFTAVFSSDYDADVTNLGATDYHLSDPGDVYAVDKGLNPGPVDDIDGEERPKGGGYDRGADEAR